MTKWLYNFAEGEAEGSASDENLLGGKGANLAEMCNLGLPVPAGFTITTKLCSYYLKNKSYPHGLKEAVKNALAKIGKETGRCFGDSKKPLLLSIRSGARVSMPGMMDTVLNLGLNDETVLAIAKETRDARFAYDSYRRFIQMYSHVVLGIDHDYFEEILDEAKIKYGYEFDTEMCAKDWQEVVVAYKECVEDEWGKPFPQNPEQQLWGAIGGVFSSWNNARAIIYRNLHNIPEDWGTAVNVQAMVFGNMGNDSATGVAFTRNPSTGKKELFGEFLLNAQGEDVVAGIRTPQNITESARKATKSKYASLEKIMPEIFADFCKIADRLERHYRDMQDLEFTIEKSKLWLLQTRSGKRTIKAAIKMAVDMTKEGLITKEEAIMRIEPQSLDQLLHNTLKQEAQKLILGSGLPASPGAACGEIVFSSKEAENAILEGRQVILVRIETSPEDIYGMHVSDGILTSRGGMTSHAAVVARGMGKPCVTGAFELRIDYQKGIVKIAGKTFKRGDIITIDGSSGFIYQGEVAMIQPELTGDFAHFMRFADESRRLKVRANVETLKDVEMAQSFGAEGIGLFRTEQMFFADERIFIMQEMILSDDEIRSQKALNKLLELQKAEFYFIFLIMQDRPMTIRLFDPPLQKFLPKTKEDIAKLAKKTGMMESVLVDKIQQLYEINPILGLRGCRLAIVYPNFVEMQARAIFEAAIQFEKERLNKNKMIKKPLSPIEIMVPLVAIKAELDFVKQIIDNVAKHVMEENSIHLPYLVGTMIELPRAALDAAQIAKSADFFSFGTNDLTQTTFGISRDDAPAFLLHYLKNTMIEQDPFTSIDCDGVGELIKIATIRGRKSRKNLQIGICGEHGGDPKSIAFCEDIGLDYVSCSPFRVPIARLAAAQAAILKKSASCNFK